jgi:hypothetical protein
MCVGPARRAATGGGAGIRIGWAMGSRDVAMCVANASLGAPLRALSHLSLCPSRSFFSVISPLYRSFGLCRVVFFTHLADTATSVCCTVALEISMRKRHRNKGVGDAGTGPN